MKYTKENIIGHAELVNNCILSCRTPSQLDIAEEMITLFISNRFKNVLNPIELNYFEDYLHAAIEVQKEKIEMAEYPTFERNMN